MGVYLSCSEKIGKCYFPKKILLSPEMIDWPITFEGRLMDVSEERVISITKTVLRALSDLGDFTSELSWGCDLQKKKLLICLNWGCQGVISLNDQPIINFTRNSEGHTSDFVHHWVNIKTTDLVLWGKEDWLSFFKTKILESSQSAFLQAQKRLSDAEKELTTAKFDLPIKEKLQMDVAEAILKLS